MFKILIGIILGVVLVTYYPQIATTTKDIFVESGARDEIVKSLKEVMFFIQIIMDLKTKMDLN